MSHPRDLIGHLAYPESEERLRAVLPSAPDFIVILDRAGIIVSVVADGSKPAVLHGIPDDEVVGRSILDIVSPERATAALEAVREVFETGEKREIVAAVDLPSGGVRKTVALRAVRSERGQVDSVLAMCWDVSEPENTLEMLREREMLLATAQRIAGIGSFTVDLESGDLHCSEETLRIVQANPDEPAPTYQQLVACTHPDDRERVAEEHRVAREAGGSVDIEYRILRTDGSIRFIHGRSEFVRDDEGRPVRLIGTAHDITERRQTEVSLQEREQELQTLLAGLGTTPVVLYDVDGRTHSTFGTGAGFPEVGIDSTDIFNKELTDYLSPLDAEQFLSFIHEVVETGEVRQIEHTFDLPGGTFTFAFTGTPFRDASGVTTGVLVVSQNITAFRLVEMALAESEEKFSRAFNAAPWPMAISDVETGRLLEMNDACVRLTGYSRGEFAAQATPPEGLWTDPESREKLLEQIRAEGVVHAIETRVESKSGQEIVTLVSAETVTISGRPCVIWQAADVTDRIDAENERLALQAKMVEAQKLESLGVLTGGIAHDINNLLVAIQGNAELALLEAELGGRTCEILGEVREASQRAAELTEQLLAYAGKGQVEVLDLDFSELVRDTSNLLRSAVPRNSTLQIDANAPARIRADVTQIRQVVMNLITNAAEALGSEGGEGGGAHRGLPRRRRLFGRVSFRRRSHRTDVFLCGGTGYRLRDGRRNPVPNFRSILHVEVDGSGPRARGRNWHRSRPWGDAACRQ